MTEEKIVLIEALLREILAKLDHMSTYLENESLKQKLGE